MEEPQSGKHVAPPRFRRVDASAPATENSIESLNNLFKDASASKKVIVIQSPGVSNSNKTKGELPNLMDAVEQSNDVVTPEESNSEQHFAPEHAFDVNNSAESGETVSAIEGPDDVGTVPLDDSGKELGADSGAQLTDGSQEIIYLNADEVRPEHVQFIDMTGGQEAANEEPPVPEPPAPHEIKVSLPKRRSTAPFVSKEDAQRTRFLCPVCQKSFRQKHLLLCHIKLHESRPRANSVYMSNCTSCGGNVRLTSEQARLLQERGTEDARIICSTCKLLGHDVVQQSTGPIELKPAFNFHCDMCACDIKLTDDQLQLVERKGAENIRIICAPCSVKDQEILAEGDQVKVQQEEPIQCNVCHRPIEVVEGRELPANLTCTDCQSKYEEEMAVENINTGVEKFYVHNCMFCSKEIYLTEEPHRETDIVCNDCANKDRSAFKPRRAPLKVPTNIVRDTPKAVEGLSVMYKCNDCFCSMQLSDEQRELLRVRGVSGTKIICASCHTKEKGNPGTQTKRPRLRIYQCDVCLSDMDYRYRPKDDDDDIVCPTCRIVEEKERSGIKTTPVADFNKCCVCRKALSPTSAQLKRLKEKGARARLKCSQCKDIPDNDEVKPKKAKTDSVDYRCDICSMSFGTSFDQFTEHFSKVHVPGSDSDSQVKDAKSSKLKLLQCPICDARFRDKANLTMHLISHKGELSGSKAARKVLCPMCSETICKSGALEHYVDVHNVTVSRVACDFETSSDFKDWKRLIEETTCSKFVLSRRANARKIQDSVYVALKCHKNMHGFFCPAKMVVKEHGEGFHVEFTETHVGHCELSNISKEDKDRIAGLLLENKTLEDISAEMCRDLEESCADYQRFSQLKCWDVASMKRELVDGREANDSEDSCLSSNEAETERLDIPESLSWLKGPESEAEVRLDSENQLLKVTLPDGVSNESLMGKKVDILRRLADVLNKCNTEDHLQILDYYLKPGELTLNGLSSGKNVEIVCDDSAAEEDNASAEEPKETLAEIASAAQEVSTAADEVPVVSATETQSEVET